MNTSRNFFRYMLIISLIVQLVFVHTPIAVAAALADETFDSSNLESYGGNALTDPFLLNGITYSIISPSNAEMSVNYPDTNFIITPSGDLGLLYNFSNNISVQGTMDFRMSSTNGSEFKIASMELDLGVFDGANSTTVTIEGYRNGVKVTTGVNTINATNSGNYGSIHYLRSNPGYGGTITFTGTEWQYIDEVRFTGVDLILAIDDLNFEAAIPPSIDVEITGFDAISNISAGTAGSATYANAAAVIAALPASATANTSAVTVPVTTWVDTDTYNPAVAGSYTFTATLGAIPVGYANAGSHTATVEVVVSAPADVEITGFDAISNISAGTAGSATYANAAAVIAALPASATANTSAVTVPVTTWVDTDTYNPAVAGSYTFTATLGAIPVGYANAGSHTATVEVVVSAPADVEITGFDAISNISAGTAGSATYANAAAVIAALPASATANTSAVTVPVTTWVDTDTYNPAVAGSYTFTATLGAIPVGYVNAGSHTATVEVVVSAPADVEITGFDAISNISAGTAGSATYANAAAVIAALPASATANTSAVTVPVTTWVDTDTYNPAVAGSYTFTATLGAIPVGYANAGSHTATVEVVVSVVAPSNDATLKASPSVKGQTVTNIGTPNAILSNETAGNVTITAAEASNSSNAGSFITIFDKNNANATVKVVKYASGTSTANFATDTAYANGIISSGDFFIIKVIAQDTTTVNYYRVNVTVTTTSSGSSDGGIITTPTIQTGAVNVVVNGKTENAGTETNSTENGKSTVTVAVNNKVIESKIDEAVKNNSTGQQNVIQIPITDTKSDMVKVELTGDIVKQLETNTFDVSVKRGAVEYIIPAKELTISNVAKELGVAETSLKDIKVEVQITKLDDLVVAKYNEVAKANGVQLVFPPTAFEVVAKTTNATGKTDDVKISKFLNYVERVMEIPAGVDPSKITTGIVFNPDGTYSHVPTSLNQKDGKWYASLNSLTNSNYSVVWNPVTVKSVENHWAKDAVNDMASRLVILNAETFEPNKTITRADFAEYIVRALGLYREGSTHENNFKDVSVTGARNLAILIANEYGIVSGYVDGTFRGDNQITREEAMVMYQRAMKITKLTGTDKERYMTYMDFTKVSGWAAIYVKDVLAAHVFNGTTAMTISPKSNLTYAEAAQAIKNLLVESKLINN
ncbi:S-layer homology domain-containing protein [Paenibacillus sp. sgz500958]|uniref:S-layer homology domain-containing protein n=1 Tax=Paenibacillus sp. sgz500958 TaxID=3242475 RepID=UPI0036D4158F